MLGQLGFVPPKNDSPLPNAQRIPSLVLNHNNLIGIRLVSVSVVLAHILLHLFPFVDYFIYGTFWEVSILGTSALLDSLLRRHNRIVSGLLHLLASLYLLMPLSFTCFHITLSFTWGIRFSDISILCLAIFNLWLLFVLSICFLSTEYTC